MKMRKIIGISILSVILLLFFGIYYFIKNSDTVAKLKFGLENSLPPLHSISSEDSSLIKKSYWGKLSASQIFRSKIRQSITFMNYDRSFNIVIFKILTQKNFSLINSFEVVKAPSDRTEREAYGQHDFNNYYTFYDHSVVVDPVEHIQLKILTDSLTTIVRNDTVVCYSAVCENLSVSYGEKKPVDIFMEGSELGMGKNIEVHLNILFLKRNDVIFMILMSPDKPDKTIHSNLLYNIIAK